MLYPAKKVFEMMNAYGKRQQPFLFGIDFDASNGFFMEPEAALEAGILFEINGKGNAPFRTDNTVPVQLVKYPPAQNEYNLAFDYVHQNLSEGNSYLTNLTFPTAIELNVPFPDLFARSKARYKLLFNTRFVVFSPEIFVQIDEGIIRSFPMKGTIDATIPGAEAQILADPKETREHNTIVDLIRNDLSMIAKEVKVNRFRYIEKIDTHEKSLLQVSSEISGLLNKDYLASLGTIFSKILPAGSVTGAPKKRTLEIIHEAETYERGFYTGVFGFFDGARLDSGVMIRFIKNENGKLIFCSGGGITVNSNAVTEYNELIDKVYVPII